GAAGRAAGAARRLAAAHERLRHAGRQPALPLRPGPGPGAADAARSAGRNPARLAPGLAEARGRRMRALLLPLLLAAGLGACVPTPVFREAPARPSPAPRDIAASMAQQIGRPVLWGGMVIELREYE